MLRWEAPSAALRAHRFLRALDRPAVQVFSANTDTGKTILTAGLVQAALRRRRPTLYVKPVQTGFPVDSDARFVQTYAPDAQVTTLVSYTDAVGPHLAAEREQRVVPDDVVLTRIVEALQAFDAKAASPTFAFLETAGGVNSPSSAGSLQSDMYRPLRLPTVLIGDARLGGISTTLSSFESLHMRGHDVASVVMFNDPRLSNQTAIRNHLHDAVTVHTVSLPPPRLVDADADRAALRAWYLAEAGRFDGILEALLKGHADRIRARTDLVQVASTKVWWPFTQHGNVAKITTVDSAHQDYMTTLANKAADGAEVPDPQLQFDACGSWWTQGLGHGSARLALEAAHAAGRYGHVMFPESIHAPAGALAERALQVLGGSWAHRVFFSDNGSTANEIALKMAFRLWEARQGQHWHTAAAPPKVVALQGSYHGDTIGAMLPSDPNSFNERVHWYDDSRGVWLQPPTVSLDRGQYRVRAPGLCDEAGGCACRTTAETASFASMADVLAPWRWTSPLAAVYRSCITRQIEHRLPTLGACLIEPLVHGAGGMELIDPLFQRELVLVARARGIPVIFDEVFVGCYRLGPASTASVLGVHPDIATYAKLLSGGLVPLALTLASEDVFNAFLSHDKLAALLHGHSYTASPVACQVAATSLASYPTSPNYDATTQRIRDAWPPAAVTALAGLPQVARAWALGTVLAIELAAPSSSSPSTPGAPPPAYTSTAARALVDTLRARGVYARPLGPTVYLMVTPFTPAAASAHLLDVLRDCLAVAVTSPLHSAMARTSGLV